MKTMNFLILTATLLLISGAVSAQQIQGTKHDLGTSGNATDNGQICVYCHTPHNALQSTSQAVPPLWNKDFTTSTFTIYASSTINNPTGQPEGVSLACLGCHDGTLALDAMLNPPENFAPTGAKMGPGGHLLGTDLSNDHPISIGYSLASDPAFVDPATVVSSLPLFAGTQDSSYQVECASCHNVHDNQIDPFLRKSNTGSALCLTCHIK